MKIEYSPAVELALAKAAAMAHQAGCASIEPMDLLAGLLDEEEGQAAVLVQAAGVGVERLRGLFPRCGAVGDEPADLTLTVASAAVLTHARELARLHAA